MPRLSISCSGGIDAHTPEVNLLFSGTLLRPAYQRYFFHGPYLLVVGGLGLGLDDALLLLGGARALALQGEGGDQALDLGGLAALLA